MKAETQSRPETKARHETSRRRRCRGGPTKAGEGPKDPRPCEGSERRSRLSGAQRDARKEVERDEKWTGVAKRTRDEGAVLFKYYTTFPALLTKRS